MLKIMLVLLYIYGGEVKLEMQPTASIEECAAKGNARIAEQMLDPKFDTGLFADCIPMPMVEAKAKE